MAELSNPEQSGSWTYRVNHGGLMRCCLQSLDEAMSERLRAGLGPPSDGDTLPCVYEKDGEPKMILEHGVWRWVGRRI